MFIDFFKGWRVHENLSYCVHCPVWGLVCILQMASSNCHLQQPTGCLTPRVKHMWVSTSRSEVMVLCWQTMNCRWSSFSPQVSFTGEGKRRGEMNRWLKQHQQDWWLYHTVAEPTFYFKGAGSWFLLITSDWETPEQKTLEGLYSMSHVTQRELGIRGWEEGRLVYFAEPVASQLWEHGKKSMDVCWSVALTLNAFWPRCSFSPKSKAQHKSVNHSSLRQIQKWKMSFV